MDNEIAKVDWKVFEAIHSLNVRDAFQKLTEQLFCYRYSMPYGVYRFFNQPYIETLPIIRDTKMIGFQSKYYDASTRLSDKKTELCNAIDGAHRKYAGLNQIVFYINKEFGCSTDTSQIKPEYMTEIETHGSRLGIEIEWCGLNQIETMLLAPENRILREYFFAKDQSLQKSIRNIECHSSSVLKNISSNMVFRGESIEVPQKDIGFEDFLNSERKLFVIHGEGGCGKSALMKKQIAGKEGCLTWVFRAVDFDCISVYDFARKYGDADFDDVLSVFDGVENKICIIDSAEKVFQADNQDILGELIQCFIGHGWRIVFTIRSQFKNVFINEILRERGVQEGDVERLTLADLKAIENRLGIVFPTDRKIKDLLCNLFYLNIYLSKIDDTHSRDLEEFFQHIWSIVICGGKNQKNTLYIKRDQYICRMVRANASQGTYYYIPNDYEDSETVHSLIEGGIIQYDEVIGGYFVCHDVYEEIVLQQIISRAYAKRVSTKAFYDDIGDSIVMRKAFRIWLRHRFESKEDTCRTFVIDTLKDSNLQPIWKDEMLVALMSENCELYAEVLDSYLKSDNYMPLNRALRILNTACKVVDETQYRSFLTEEEVKSFNIYLFTKPTGSGWTYLLSFIYCHRESIPWTMILVSLVIDVIYAWAANERVGAATRYAGLIALYLYDCFIARSRRDLDRKRMEKVCDTIVRSANEIGTELRNILNEVIECGITNYSQPYTILCKHILKDCFHTGVVCETMPDQFVSIAKMFWLEESVDHQKYDSYGRRIGFGIREYADSEYYPSGAFHTPVMMLLQVDPRRGIDFVVELINTTTEIYATWCNTCGFDSYEEIEIHMPDGSTCVQISNSKLWGMYRGMSVAPNLLQSALMALERRLDQIISVLPEHAAAELCHQVISKSHSVAITAVIMSMVIAHSDKLFQVACTLLKTRSLFFYDQSRLALEHETGLFLGNTPRNRVYDNERIRENNREFRKKSFEDTIVGYQINTEKVDQDSLEARLNRLYQIIDKHFTPEEDLSVEERFLLYRIDTRRMRGEIVRSNTGEKMIALTSDLPQDLKDVQNNHRLQTKDRRTYLSLLEWGRARYERDSNTYEKYSEYECDPQKAYDDALILANKSNELFSDCHCLMYVAAVLLRDFNKEISSKMIDECQKCIIDYLVDCLNQKSTVTIGDGIEAAITTLPYLFASEYQEYSIRNPKVLFTMLMLNEDRTQQIAVETLRKEIWSISKGTSMQLLSLYSKLYAEYRKKVLRYNGISSAAFVKQYKDLIKKTFECKEEKYPEISTLDNKSLMVLSMMLPIQEEGGSFEMVVNIGKVLWEYLFGYEKHGIDEEKRNINLEQEYIRWFSDFVLRISREKQVALCNALKPFLKGSRCTNNLLTQLLFQHDVIRDKTSFWLIWNEMFDTIKEFSEEKSVSKKNEDYYEEYWSSEVDQVVETYLFAWPYWKEGIKEWHSIGSQEVLFFERAASEFKGTPSVLYSIAYILNSVGYRFLGEGVRWLYSIINKDKELVHRALPMNTEYYMDEYMNRFIRAQKSIVKKNPEIRVQTLSVLDFLVERGSTCAYMLREGMC